jgi:hypothetical protein
LQDRLVIHWQRPLFEIDHLEASWNRVAAYLRHPFGYLGANAPRPRAADDDEDF